jgi:hypothetical protein
LCFPWRCDTPGATPRRQGWLHGARDGPSDFDSFCACQPFAVVVVARLLRGPPPVRRGE